MRVSQLSRRNNYDSYNAKVGRRDYHFHQTFPEKSGEIAHTIQTRLLQVLLRPLGSKIKLDQRQDVASKIPHRPEDQLSYNRPRIGKHPYHDYPRLELFIPNHLQQPRGDGSLTGESPLGQSSMIGGRQDCPVRLVDHCPTSTDSACLKHSRKTKGERVAFHLYVSFRGHPCVLSGTSN